MTNRRNFLKTIATAAAAAVPSAKFAGQTPSHPGASAQSFNILHRPDHVSARFGSKEILPLQYASSAWTLPLLRVTIEPTATGQGDELPVCVRSEGAGLTHLRIRWEGKTSETLLSLGDAWERSYGDLEWRGIVPERVMPWYFLTFDGRRVNGYGVKTQASSFCFWQRDSDGITLWIDLRNGGEAAELAGRDLLACTVVTHVGAVGEDISHSGQAFCRLMCPTPRLPKEAVFGVNDWNYAYGMNTANGILRDADLAAILAPAGAVRPLVVIDDGWQDPARFPSMADLALRIRKRRLRPGLWIRPLRANATVPAAWLLPDARFGKNAPHTNLALDPTHPEALDAALETVRTTVAWGYEFIKHDFTTWELLGRWGFAMHGEPTGSGWHFHDRTRTNAEILGDLYRAIRSAAGEKVTILGCNTIGHLAAGIFESQRIGDDTSGHDWERTRRYGLNSLSHRIIQHRTFTYIDPDCVAITPQVGWRETSQWMDVVARSGTSLFCSPDPDAMTPEIRSAMRDALFLASQNGYGAPVRPTSGTTPAEWRFTSPHQMTKTYDWCGPEGVSPFDV